MLWKNAILEASGNEIAELKEDPKFRRWSEAIEAAIDRGDYTHDAGKDVYKFWNCYV